MSSAAGSSASPRTCSTTRRTRAPTPTSRRARARRAGGDLPARRGAGARGHPRRRAGRLRRRRRVRVRARPDPRGARPPARKLTFGGRLVPSTSVSTSGDIRGKVGGRMQGWSHAADRSPHVHRRPGPRGLCPRRRQPCGLFARGSGHGPTLGVGGRFDTRKLAVGSPGAVCVVRRGLAALGQSPGARRRDLAAGRISASCRRTSSLGAVRLRSLTRAWVEVPAPLRIRSPRSVSTGPPWNT